MLEEVGAGHQGPLDGHSFGPAPGLLGVRELSEDLRLCRIAVTSEETWTQGGQGWWQSGAAWA